MAEKVVVMKEKFENWIGQRSTWMAIGAAAIVVLSYVQPDWVGMAAGVLSAFGLVANDKKK